MKFKLILLFLLALSVSACQTLSDVSAGSGTVKLSAEEVNTMSDSAFQAAIFPVVERLMTAVIAGKPETIINDCCSGLRERLNADAFAQQARLIRENYGEFIRVEPGLSFRQPPLRAFVSKAVFRYTDRKGKSEIREIPCSVHFAFEDGELKIFVFALSPLS